MIAGAVMLHLGIASAMGLWWFSAIMISAEATFLKDAEYLAIGRNIKQRFTGGSRGRAYEGNSDRVIVVFDDACGICSVVIRHIRGLPVNAKVRFIGVSMLNACGPEFANRASSANDRIQYFDGPLTFEGALAMNRLCAGIAVVGVLLRFIERVSLLRAIEIYCYDLFARHRSRISLALGFRKCSM